MIVTIEGILTESEPLRAVINCGGLGYEVHVPLTTAEKLPAPGEKVKLHTLQVFREDSQMLFGFSSRRDREFFRLLTEKVSGIGPRIALNLLSRLTVDLLEDAIRAGDAALLSKCPGIGKKTAERLIIELRDPLKAGTVSDSISLSGSAGATPAGTQPSALQDAVAALMALGYKLPDADKAVRQAMVKAGPDATTETLVRSALGGK
jgi:Holliday junction DNA helicase RuvA